MANVSPELWEEAHCLAQQLVGSKKAGSSFAEELVDICARARGKDCLIIHNPGGWGHTPLRRSQAWERSIVEGIVATMGSLGYGSLLVQHFRTRGGWWEGICDMKEQFRFFASKAMVMAAGLQFVVEHLTGLKVLLVGVSQGAAFSNAVMQQRGLPGRVYSVELGFPSLYRHRRAVGGRTLAIDSNGVAVDALAQGSLKVGMKVFAGAPLKWVKYRLQGTPVDFPCA